MKTNAATFCCTLTFIQLVGVCFCTSMLGFVRDATNYTMPQWFTHLPSVPRERCFAKCSKFPECYFVSYDTVRGDCKLSAPDVLLPMGQIPATGWSVFRALKAPCDFKTIGVHYLAICNTPVVKAEADTACASFGSWRLLEPRTLEMYWEIVDYLLAMPVGVQDIYGSAWVGVEFDDVLDDWYFPDNTTLPLESANSNDVNGSQTCLRMRQSRDYQYADQPCDETYGYICEKI